MFEVESSQLDVEAIRQQAEELSEIAGYAKHVSDIVERELAAAAEMTTTSLEAE